MQAVHFLSLRVWVLCAVAIPFAQPTGVAAETIHIFLIGGQSNADGRADSRGLPRSLQLQRDIPYYYEIDDPVTHLATTRGMLTVLRKDTSRTGQFGPELTFGRAMADYYAPAAESVALVKFAAGGTNLVAQWAADGTADPTLDGPIYRSFQFIVSSGLAALRAAHRGATLRIEGMIWMQGEKDAVQGAGEAYQAALEKFVADIRLTYGADLPFVIGRLSSAQSGAGDVVQRDRVRAAQEAVAAAFPRTAVVDTDAFPLSDGLHFDSAGQQALGRAFATAVQGLVPALSPSIWSTRFAAAPQRTIRTAGATYTFRGVAPTGAVKAVYLMNRRLGSQRYFKAKGIREWTRQIALRPGRNLIVLCARGMDGVRRKVAWKVVVRRSFGG